MNDAAFPLPSDEDLAPDAREIISNLPPLNVFRAVAALPASLRPFLELGASLLAGQNLTPAERELVILRVAHVTGAGYERHQHEQLAAAAGLDAGQIAATASADPATGLDADGALICRATDEITRDVRLSDSTLARVRERWGDDGARELILTAGYYNMVSRYLESTRVPLEEADVLGDADPERLVREGRERAGSGEG
ncbi:MAG: carboxymuconolactone decarboxylase family protein [Solirubrobacterales bacterium]|nr:carboxymuconolactone decarboxylase family protein [Solirubrobacterales bacterium]